MEEHGAPFGKPFKQVAKKSASLPPQNAASRSVPNGRILPNHSLTRKRSGSSGLSVASDDDDDDDDALFRKSSATELNGLGDVAASSTPCVTNGTNDRTVNDVVKTACYQSVDEDSDGIVIINDYTDCDKLVGRHKRTHSATVSSAENTECKKSRLDQKNGASVSFKKKIFINRKIISEWCVDFEKTLPNEERNFWKQKVKDLEDTCEKWKKLSLDLQRQLEEIRCENKKAAIASSVVRCENKKAAIASSVVRSPVTSTAPVSMSMNSPAAVSKTSQPIARSVSASSVPVPIAVRPVHQQTKSNSNIPPNLLPPASANLLSQAYARLGLPASSSSSSLASTQSESAVAKLLKSPNLAIIDLTDDDMQVQPKSQSTNIRTPVNVVCARPATLVINAASPMMRPAIVSYALTAAVRPTVMQAQHRAPIPTMPVRAIRQFNAATQVISARHPAPLPPLPMQPRAPNTAKRIPTKPTLKLSRVTQGIVLSWNMATTDDHEPAVQYQLFAYQQGPEIPTAALWKKVGTVEALPLPMACTLTQFQVGNRYHFAVRAVDLHGRIGAFSEPGSIHLEAISTQPS